MTSTNSNIPPYYPQLAKQKNVSDTIIGIVFGIQPFVAAFMAPVVGSSLHRIGRTNALLLSGLLMSACAFLLGISSFMSKTPFILFSCIARALHGLSNALLSTSSLSIISADYRSKMEKMISLREQINGMFLIIGPVTGMVILTFADFEAIFFFFSALLLIEVCFFWKIFPPEISSYSNQRKVSWKFLFSVPVVLLDCGVVISTYGALGSLEPIIANYVSDTFGLNKKYCALFFIVPILAYPISVAVSNAFFPNTNKKTKMKTGLLMISISLLFLGPCEVTGLPSTMIGTILSLFFIGAGMGPAVIPALPDMNSNAIEDLPHIDKNMVSDRVSSLIPFSVFLGKSVFSVLAGVLSDHLDFNRTTAIISCIVFSYLLIYTYLTQKIKEQKIRPLGESELIDRRLISLYFVI